MDNPHVKTLELLKDWSTWLVAIDVGALTILGSLSDWHDSSATVLISAAAVCFLVSLVAATYLVGAVPVLVQRVIIPTIDDDRLIQVKGRTSVYEFKYGPLVLQRIAEVQHYGFIAAAIFATAAFLFEAL